MRYTARKILTLLVTMAVVSFLTFAACDLISGDPAATLLGTQATPEKVAALREEMGLNRPLPVRYGEWLAGFFTGNLGTSFQYRQPVREVLASTTMDEGRILTEAAIFADKVAVDEETVRLRSHVAQLRSMLEAQRPTGKDMDFLMQEFNRECNTIGSKCNDLAVTQDVVAMKAEVEKIREQVQNIE